MRRKPLLFASGPNQTKGDDDKMKKLILTSIFALALLIGLAPGVPPPPKGIPGYIAQCEIPVCILIDKYVELICPGDCLILYEKPGEWWEGYTYVTIFNNWSVKVNALIEPYLPNIEKSSKRKHLFHCMIEGAPGGWKARPESSSIQLNPYPSGYTFRVYAGIQSPNLLARASSSDVQVVATIYITVQN
jgi:hypothetical protein